MFGDGVDRKSLQCLAALQSWYNIRYGKLSKCGEKGEHCGAADKKLLIISYNLYTKLCEEELTKGVKQEI